LLVTSAAGYAAWSRFGASPATNTAQQRAGSIDASVDTARFPAAVVTTLPPETRLVMNHARRDVIPAALAGKRFFEDLAPNEVERNTWYDLLNREPDELVWPGTALSSHRVDPGERRLRVSSEDTALLALGTADFDDYTFQVDIHQNLWRGGVGVFFGYHQAEREGKPCWRYQSISLARIAGPYSKQFPFQLTRADTVLWLNDAGRLQSTRTTHCGALIRPLGFQTQQLEIAVNGGRLARVRWSGQELPELVSTEVNQHFEPNAYRGKFGTYNGLSDSTFMNARIYVPAGQQIK
ncbi:MAG: hypothetical protein WED34_21560, partial [Planctomycetales bacterium]